MTRTFFAALAALAIAASPALAGGEQPHPGFITPTYAGGHVGAQSGETAGGFDLSRAMPLYSGGQMMNQQGSEGASGFDAMLATKVGRGRTTSGVSG
jgi:hypothetical protein